MSSDLSAELVALDRNEEPWAVRFDRGPAFSGDLVFLPSAFNPPTLAHGHLLERAVALISGPSPASREGSSGTGDRVRSGSAIERRAHPVALLTTRNVDKGLNGASLEQRIEMLLALADGWPQLAVAASNQARIIDQAESLRAAFGEGLGLNFVVGFDTLERLFAPRYYTDMEAELAPFFARSRVLAANRADVSPGDVSRWISDHAGGFSGRISVLEIDEHPASMSSTHAREGASNGDDGMLPDGVYRYIQAHGLYR